MQSQQALQINQISTSWHIFHCLQRQKDANDEMPRNRPLDKNIYLHLKNGSKMPNCYSAEADTLYWLWPFLVSLKANFSHCYNPYSQQAVEEARIKYKGNTSLKKIYMLKKSIKHLMKRWCGVDSCSGYQSNFDIDTRCPRTSVENRFVVHRLPLLRNQGKVVKIPNT